MRSYLSILSLNNVITFHINIWLKESRLGPNVCDGNQYFNSPWPWWQKAGQGLDNVK